MNNTEKSYKKLPPFKGWVLQNFPFIEEDFDALTNYQMMCKVTEYLKVIQNNVDYIQDEEFTPLYNAFVELKNYVDNYFDNLDIQTEINNKLDEMAESGQLADIIAQYLQVNSVLGFDTKATLKSAENLVNGSITRTLGTDTYNDGKGNYYKIRTLTSGDIIDDDNILALTNYPTLIAEKMPDYRMNQAETDIDNIEDDINTINNTTIPAIQEEINNLSNERYILIGDSYAVYRPDTQGIEGWAVPLRRMLNLSNDDCYIIEDNGGGFIASGSTGTFLNGLENLSVTDPSSITKIVVCGGLNDMDSSKTAIKTAIESFVTYCNTNYPNAKIYLGMIGWDNDDNYTIDNQYSRYKVLNNVLPAWKESIEYNVIYLNGVENIMHNYSEYYDRSHPNQNMCLNLANGIKQALNTGYCSINYPIHNINFSNPQITLNSFSVKEQVVNNITYIYDLSELGSEIQYTYNYPATSNNQFYVGAISSNYLRTLNSNDILFTCPVLITDTNNNTYKITGSFYNKNYNYIHFGSAELPNGINIKSIKLYHPYTCMPTASR